jgi:hypothetical protein
MGHTKRPRFKERFAALPVAVLTHAAFTTLPVGFQRVLWLLAAEFNGYNNGNLALTRKQALEYGLNNERHRSHGLRELERRGLIEKTRQGLLATGARVPTLWALAWHPTHYLEGRLLEVPRRATRGWEQWSADIAADKARTRRVPRHAPDE